MSHTTALSPTVFTTFGDLLRYLRRRAQLQQRDLAIAVGYSESQICRLEQNQRLPDVTTLLARFVPALDLDEQPELATRLLELAAAARGEHLDGLGISAIQTVWPPTTDDPPAPPARPARPGNLPAPLTALIDRTEEVAAVQACLGRSDVRLLTLIGPPGIGKTRLTLHIAGNV